MVTTATTLETFLADSRTLKSALPSSLSAPTQRYLRRVIDKLDSEAVEFVWEAPQIAPEVLGLTVVAGAALVLAAVEGYNARADALEEQARDIYAKRAQDAERYRRISAFRWGELVDTAPLIVDAWRHIYHMQEPLQTRVQEIPQAEAALRLNRRR